MLRVARKIIRGYTLRLLLNLLAVYFVVELWMAEKSVKNCTRSGQWAVKDGLEWTDYRPCLNKQVSQRRQSLTDDIVSDAFSMLCDFYTRAQILLRWPRNVA